MFGTKKAKVVMFGGVPCRKVAFGADFKVELVEIGESMKITWNDINPKYKVEVIGARKS